jgi:hypothetical protein
MMLDYLMEMGAMQPQQDAITQQRAMAQQLRGNAGTPGMRDSGKMVHAAHPLEFLSQMANTGVGIYKDQQANQMQTQLGTDKRSALGRARDRMSGTAQTGDDPYAVGGW